ncbi:DUF2065 family protein [candidate division NPL-UPA2 bacterium]|nr:DUF2065 family protein [candidate division NPL-UPA2 bacterium]
MDQVYMFTFRNLKWIFAGICFALLAEGIIWFFIPGKITHWVSNISKVNLRILGAIEIIVSLGLLYLIIYH